MQFTTTGQEITFQNLYRFKEFNMAEEEKVEEPSLVVVDIVNKDTGLVIGDFHFSDLGDNTVQIDKLMDFLYESHGVFQIDIEHYDRR